MATIQEIKQRAATVREATQVGENTAERVGGVLVDLADTVDKKFDKTSIVQETGDGENVAMSQKAVSDKIVAIKSDIAGLKDKDLKHDEALAKKANAADVASKFTEEAARVDGELGKKANAEDTNNSMQELDKKLNRNLLAIEFDDDTGELNAILGQDTTIKSVETDEDGNVIIEQEIS